MAEAPAAGQLLDDRSLLAWALGTFHAVLRARQEVGLVDRNEH